VPSRPGIERVAAATEQRLTSTVLGSPCGDCRLPLLGAVGSTADRSRYGRHRGFHRQQTMRNPRDDRPTHYGSGHRSGPGLVDARSQTRRVHRWDAQHPECNRRQDHFPQIRASRASEATMGALSSPVNIGHRLASVPRPSRRSNADGRLIAPAADAATIQADSGGARPMPARPGGRPKGVPLMCRARTVMRGSELTVSRS